MVNIFEENPNLTPALARIGRKFVSEREIEIFSCLHKNIKKFWAHVSVAPTQAPSKCWKKPAVFFKINFSSFYWQKINEAEKKEVVEIRKMERTAAKKYLNKFIVSVRHRSVKKERLAQQKMWLLSTCDAWSMKPSSGMRAVSSEHRSFDCFLHHHRPIAFIISPFFHVSCVFSFRFWLISFVSSQDVSRKICVMND